MPLRAQTKQMFDQFLRAMQQIEVQAIREFEQFFRTNKPAADAKGYEFVDLTSIDSLDQIWRGRGFYMIASDFEPALGRQNPCQLTVDGLPVIYRGQADLVRERIKSHLHNSSYREKKKKDGAGIWNRCLKLSTDSRDGGIDFDTEPYRNHRWVVLVLPLRASKTGFRNCVEWGFDTVYGKPIASNEKAKRPDESVK